MHSGENSRSGSNKPMIKPQVKSAPARTREDESQTALDLRTQALLSISAPSATIGQMVAESVEPLAVKNVPREQPDGQSDELHLSLARFIRRSRRLSAKREPLLSLRSRTKAEMRNIARHRNFVRESHAALLGELEALQAKGPVVGQLEQLRVLHAKACNDYESHDKKSQDLQEMMSELERLETSMQGIEARVEQEARTLSDLLKPTIVLAENASSVKEFEVSSASADHTEPSTPAAIEDYLGKVGDMKLAKDELSELDYDWAEAKSKRQLLRDQEVEPTLPDEEFEEYWLQAFAEAEVTLAVASSKAKLSHQVCVSEGLDPEVYCKGSSNSPPAENASSSPSGLVSGKTSSIPLLLAPGDATKAEKSFAPGLFHSKKDPYESQVQMQRKRHLERVADWVGRLSDRRSQPARLPLEVNSASSDDEAEEADGTRSSVSQHEARIRGSEQFSSPPSQFKPPIVDHEKSPPSMHKAPTGPELPTPNTPSRTRPPQRQGPERIS